jgi:ATP-dependent Clp protease adaptor protein ClpS
MATELETRPAELTGDETDLDQPYNVFLWNDPVTPMDVVTRALRKIFGYDTDKAELLMITAHLEGKAVVWTGGRTQAEQYCVQLGLHGLQSTVGRDA